MSLLYSNATQAQINYVINPSFERILTFDTGGYNWVDVIYDWHGTDTNCIGCYTAAVLSTMPNHDSNLPIPNPSWGGVYQYPARPRL